jgi:hypothetical protein
MKYYKTISELIDSYESIHGATVRVFRRQLMNSMMTHAYELGYKHATEEGEASNG